MKNNYAQSQSDKKVFGQIIDFNFAGNFSCCDSSTIVDEGTSNQGRSSRIRSGRVSRSNASSLLMKSAEFAGMNGAMLGTRGSCCSPTLGDSMMARNVENELRVNLTHVVPVQNSRGKGISDCQANVGEEQSWSLNSNVNGCCDQKCECAESEILDLGVRGIHNRGQEHSKAEDVSQSAVDSSALRAENNGITTGASQNVEW